MRNGSLALAEYPSPVVRIECERCGRAGSYRLDGLVARFGADAAPPDVLMALASCERRADFSRPCGAKFMDLATRFGCLLRFGVGRALQPKKTGRELPYRARWSWPPIPRAALGQEVISEPPIGL